MMNQRTMSRLLTRTAPRCFLGFCFFLYVFIPLLVFCFPSIPAVLVFLNMVGWPAARWCNFKEPSKEFGLESATNFYLDSAPGVTLGVWRIPPSSSPSSSSSSSARLSSTAASDPLSPMAAEAEFDGRPVVLYLHGNSAHRASAHRVELYRLFASMGYYVVCFDYRGYGDSTGSPTEAGLVHDALVVYRWILERRAHSPVFLWGHSLGTGVACHLGRKIFEQIDGGEKGMKAPKGVVLESPFSNLKDEVREHKFAKPFRRLPYFEAVFLGAFDRVNLHFQSDIHVRFIRAPILFLHADDDHVIPYHLAQRLYQASKRMENGEIRFGEERVSTAEGVDQLQVSLALRNIQPQPNPHLNAKIDANDNSQPGFGSSKDTAHDAAAADDDPVPNQTEAGAHGLPFRRQFVGFTGRAGYRHKWLVRAPEIQPVIRDFIGS